MRLDAFLDIVARVIMPDYSDRLVCYMKGFKVLNNIIEEEKTRNIVQGKQISTSGRVKSINDFLYSVQSERNSKKITLLISGFHPVPAHTPQVSFASTS